MTLHVLYSHMHISYYKFQKQLSYFHSTAKTSEGCTVRHGYFSDLEMYFVALVLSYTVLCTRRTKIHKGMETNT